MPSSVRIAEFDVWREGYQGAEVEVLLAGTTTPAPVFLDALLTQPASNPQTLLSYTDNFGSEYGKWAAPIYTTAPYSLLINASAQTGIEVPRLVSLAGQDASGAMVSSTRGRYPRSLATSFDRFVDASAFGTLAEIDGSATCGATLLAAIGAAAAQNGGYVDLPAGSIPFTSLTLPQGVVLRGAGVGVTTLRSLNTQAVITLGGDGSGLADLTLDGVNVISGSIGVYGVDISSPVFSDVLIKRFDFGLRLKGASSCAWQNFSILNCNTGADLRGDSDTGASGAGTAIENIRWQSGRVSLNTVAGLVLNFFDKPVRNVSLVALQFVGNLAAALKINGARSIICEDCYWSDNITNVLVQDDTNLALVDQNTVETLTFRGGRIVGGTLQFGGICADVSMASMRFEGVSFNMVIPSNPVTLIDCVEDAAVTSTGDATKLLRLSTNDRGVVSGITGDGTAITAWSQLLAPGAAALIVVRAVARRRNGIELGIFHIQTGVSRPGAGMNVALVTSAFTAGDILRGQTSGASARITAATPSGGSTQLVIRDITGAFLPGELVVDSGNGSGRMNGQLTYSDAALDGGGVEELRAPQVTGSAGYAATLDTSGGQVRARVTGAVGHVVEWTIAIDLCEP